MGPELVELDRAVRARLDNGDLARVPGDRGRLEAEDPSVLGAQALQASVGHRFHGTDAGGGSKARVPRPAADPPGAALVSPRVLRLTDRNRPWWALIGSCIGLFLLMLDSTVVALALPAIQHDLDASASSLQWVMNAYLLTIAVLVVTAGRLGDMLGRKRIFVIGLCVFAAGSVISATAGDDTAIIAGRVAQGIGRRAAALALARDHERRLPRLPAGAGDRHLDRGVLDRARGRAAVRRAARRGSTGG